MKIEVTYAPFSETDTRTVAWLALPYDPSTIAILKAALATERTRKPQPDGSVGGWVPAKRAWFVHEACVKRVLEILDGRCEDIEFRWDAVQYLVPGLKLMPLRAESLEALATLEKLVDRNQLTKLQEPTHPLFQYRHDD